MERWHVGVQVSENFYLMCRTKDGAVQYAPLYIHSFRLNAPRKLLEAQAFLRKYRSYEEIQSIRDRLRWCRHQRGWMQKDVAARVGLSRAQYVDLECGTVTTISKAVADKLAALYDIPVGDLLDGYNRFLYDGQGQRLRTLREQAGLQLKPFARLLGVSPELYRHWEREDKQISRQSWEVHFKDFA